MSEDIARKEKLKEKPMSFLTLVVITGFTGGILLSGLAYLAYVFDFTTISPRVILEPWTVGDWKKSWLGTVISILLIGAISILVALIYYGLLRKFKSMWVGIAYGLLLFLLVFFVLNPIFPGIPPFNDLNVNTLVTSICLYVLYGLFVGYTISYEELEINSRISKEDDVKA
ncbi:YqhR family membrane protein [Niallia sp. Krafla_26]|uniref:YqhR family membrane protein n=1 Tax=Niallia sp. Krafla_26 TaxID=3064703 RepID=UPI003D175393